MGEDMGLTKSKTLHLTLKKKWFDMILSGEKKEEYRERKEYWKIRLADKRFTVIKFRNGYQKNARSFTIQLLDIKLKFGCTKWGAPVNQIVYVLELGKIL